MLGVFALGNEVTFDLTWSRGGLLRVDVHPNKEGLLDFVDIALEGLPAAMARLVPIRVHRIPLHGIHT
tara:strand:- start:325 stop:528 length:204 start_codon:yes stop_codon:yes gene_type:complete